MAAVPGVALWGALLTMLATGSAALACPFCSAVSQTIRQEMEAMDAVVIAEALPETQRDPETGEVTLRVARVYKGEDLLQKGDPLKTVYFGKVEPGRRFLLNGVEPPRLMWSSPLPVSERAEKYVTAVTQLSGDDVDRLRFFQQYLQDEDSMLARDAYDEFAITPYEAVQALGPEMDREQLIEWIRDPEMAADRRRLYLTMLGVCGTDEDGRMLEKMMRSTQASDRNGLDALIACYLSLVGAEGLPTVDELFLANKQAAYADTYAAIMALRFHGTEGEVIPRSEVVQSLHHVLDRPDLADLVIPDLARWGDWSQIDRLVQLFKDADEENNWLRVPVVNYLRACPLPEAKEAMAELEKIDPKAVKRANTLFMSPIPPAESKGSTSSLRRQPPESEIAMREAPGSKSLGRSLPAAPVSAGRTIADARRSAAQAAAVAVTRPEAAVSPNRWQLLNVSVLGASSLGIGLWLVLSGGGVASASRR